MPKLQRQKQRRCKGCSVNDSNTLQVVLLSEESNHSPSNHLVSGNRGHRSTLMRCWRNFFPPIKATNLTSACLLLKAAFSYGSKDYFFALYNSKSIIFISFFQCKCTSFFFNQLCASYMQSHKTYANYTKKRHSIK